MNDHDLMRRAFAVARRARANGNTPFGAVLVDAAGAVVLEAENTARSERDCTGHAETNLMRIASRRYGLGALGGFTMVTSAEPCCMCAGAAFWSGLDRVVYGLSSERLATIWGAAAPPMLRLGCREVLARGDRRVTVDGPMLEDEAAALFANA